MRTVVLTQLAGAYDNEFWMVDAVRAAETYPAVWFAGVALTEMYQSIAHAKMSRSQQLSRRIRAMENYGRAVRSILDVTGQASVTLADKKAVILSSLLLIGFCNLENNVLKLTAHVRNAFQILNQWQLGGSLEQSSESGSIINTSSLIRQLQRFEVECAILNIPHAFLNEGIRAVPASSSFTSASAAYTEFLSISPPCMAAIMDAAKAALSEKPIPESVLSCRRLFKQWKAKFVTLLQARDHDSSDECLLSLRIWSITIEIGLFVERSGLLWKELAYDAWNPLFEKQLDLAEQLRAAITKNVTGQGGQRSRRLLQPFSFSKTIADALVLVHRCRVGSVRRRAIALLRNWPHQQGLGSNYLVADIMEAKTQVEEEAFLLPGAARPAGCQCVAPHYICPLHRCIKQQVRQPEQLRSENMVSSQTVVRLFLPADLRGPQNLVERTLTLNRHYVEDWL
ncbi:hypothetical protein NLG97_g6883 [Lecanicillium saksenae]|uniref:Uncharacterized protein n=1 Tax=Lecanicillium saksenae TaxID=468837 RepID=A0ACC1QNE4_9HYPO|nr:hypothetical protein NLG97_g6883 [Lecanicillium saksenae]